MTLATAQTISGEKTFTSVANFQSSPSLGTIKLSPASGVGESGVGLYYNSNRSLETDGDLWFLSSSSFSSARRFAILSRGNTTATARLLITTAGLVTIPGTLSVTGAATVGGLTATNDVMINTGASAYAVSWAPTSITP